MGEHRSPPARALSAWPQARANLFLEESPPRGSARIQDLYGMDETPRVADGRQEVLLEILAPNMRAVQITDDLARFWRELYPSVRQQLAKRYPKHEWR